ncbi:MAG TPA: hypothetical protein VFA11_07865 [Acidimicrobiales bacterium]|nr:hypothetical protein [Acidimicrobiales bacterium]
MTDLEQVLQLVNAGRAALGRSPISSLPRGRQRSNSDCVLARSLGVSFGNRTAWPVVGSRRERKVVAGALADAWRTRRDLLDKRVVRIPEVLRDFVADFDGGVLPALVDDEADGPEGGARQDSVLLPV